MKPVCPFDEGPAVEDVQQRLTMLGYDLGARGIDGVYRDDTIRAVRAFRESEGLAPKDIVDDECWSALVDATFNLGDRTLFLRFPYFHGHDVEELQEALNALGFSCGPRDGILGANTERAVREFQGNVGIDPDGIMGQWTFEAIMRLHHVWRGKDEVPREEAKTGYSRAAEVLERSEICFYGIDEPTKGIAARIANLARATTADSMVTSAEYMEALPPESMLLVRVVIGDERASRGIPRVVFSDEATLAARIGTALSNTGKPLRVEIAVPINYFKDPAAPTVREQQHAAVELLDAFCEALS